MKTVLIASAMLLWLALGVVAHGQVIATGTFQLDPSTGPGDPAFNSPLTAMHIVPGTLVAPAGSEIRVGLRDLSRPTQVCDLEDTFGDLFSGCAAVDWPFPGRRGINLISFDTPSGVETLHLNLGDTLAADPEPSDT